MIAGGVQPQAIGTTEQRITYLHEAVHLVRGRDPVVRSAPCRSVIVRIKNTFRIAGIKIGAVAVHRYDVVVGKPVIFYRPGAAAVLAHVNSFVGRSRKYFSANARQGGYVFSFHSPVGGYPGAPVVRTAKDPVAGAGVNIMT